VNSSFTVVHIMIYFKIIIETSEERRKTSEGRGIACFFGVAIWQETPKLVSLTCLLSARDFI
jgi:hypothetical protein